MLDEKKYFYFILFEWPATKVSVQKKSGPLINIVCDPCIESSAPEAHGSSIMASLHSFCSIFPPTATQVLMGASQKRSDVALHRENSSIQYLMEPT